MSLIVHLGIMFCTVRFLITGISLSLAWGTRLKIAIGAAKGLAFLHGADTPVIYRDFKTSNVLLDSVSNLIFPLLISVAFVFFSSFFWGCVCDIVHSHHNCWMSS